MVLLALSVIDPLAAFVGTVPRELSLSATLEACSSSSGFFSFFIYLCVGDVGSGSSWGSGTINVHGDRSVIPRARGVGRVIPLIPLIALVPPPVWIWRRC